jgi:hypothetical protein
MQESILVTFIVLNSEGLKIEMLLGIVISPLDERLRALSS